nr:tail fiber assembly protein [Escherichia coli]
MLPQHSDIEIAWYASIQQEPNGWKTVTTQFYIQEFSEYIAPLQDAVDLEIATEEERSLLEAWNKYRVLLNRVDTSTAPDIEWPAILSGSIIGIMPQTRRMQERAAVSL